MIDDRIIYDQLPLVLTETHLDFLGEHYAGKVRDNYSNGNIRYLITSDRLSCFDVIVASIPFKGQVLTQMAVSWFERTKDIVPNHIIDVPDPNVIVAQSCSILPVEVVVRAYLTGSAWRDYEAGRLISGIVLPPHLRKSQKLDEPIITPSTKAPRGSHDMPISEKEITSSGLVDPSLWQQVRECALALFARGTKVAQERGLLLVDTKYEFGLDENGVLLLADEIHTLDCSRYWKAESYPARFAQGVLPEMLDKEPTRQWLLQQGYRGEGPIPAFSDTHRVETAQHYIRSFEDILGTPFKPCCGDVHERVEAALKTYVGTPSRANKVGGS